MTKPKVFITNPLYPAAMELVNKFCTIEVYTSEKYPSHDELLERITDKDGLICFVANKIGKEIMDAGPKLKVISTAGAGLDVFEKEPISVDNPLIGLDNVVLLPHIGSSTEETRIKMELMAVENILRVFKGERPSGWLNPEVEKLRSLPETKII